MLRTDSQRKELCTGCSLAQTIDLVGDTQTLLIVKILLDGPSRFGEICESLHGVSTRTVTNKIKYMASSGLVQKSVKMPDHYELTKKGKGLKPVLDAMRAFGKRHA